MNEHEEEIKKTAQEHWDRVERPRRCCICSVVVNEEERICDNPFCAIRERIGRASERQCETATDPHVIEALEGILEVLEDKFGKKEGPTH